MNYQGFLSQLTEQSLNIIQGMSNISNNTIGLPADSESIEELPVTTVHTLSSSETIPATTTTTESLTTIQRKATPSSRFLNAFQQFYGNSSGGSSSNPVVNDNNIDGNVMGSTMLVANRTPTKGMEAKLLSMWHNVKYGWNGKLKSNFSKEQPVWLLGRCYHRKISPTTSMDSSMELSAASSLNGNRNIYSNQSDKSNGEQNAEQLAKTSSNPYDDLKPEFVEEFVVPQELALDATESQLNENPWEEGIEGFKRDFYSRIWMTYRREFPIMNGSNYTSDCGWGCMLRSGQMLLAQALLCHFLGRSWRYDPDTQLYNTYEDNLHKKIIQWFGDSSSKNSPFSIHALVRLGEEMGKKPGDWYGPASVSYLLRRALKNAAVENVDFDNLVIYVAKDCTIYMADVENECCKPEPTPKMQAPWYSKHQAAAKQTKNSRPKWKSLILLVPLRLGSEKLNPIYAHCLKLLLSTEYCIGIIGGRPKHSLYFVGFQEDKLIHLDPHYCQEMVDVNQENFPLHSFHCKSPRKLKLNKIDPSCCIGFYCQNHLEFTNFVETIQMYLHPLRCASGTIEKTLQSGQQMPSTVQQLTDHTAELSYPLFSFTEGKCLQHEINMLNDELTSSHNDLRPYNSSTVSTTNRVIDDDETEEFVML